MQAVAAQQETLAGVDVAVPHLQVQGRLDADRTGDAVAQGMADRRLRCDGAGIDEFLDHAVIRGQQLDRALAAAIEAAVAGPQAGVAVAPDRQRHHRRAGHARTAELGADPLVRGRNAVAHRFLADLGLGRLRARAA